MFAKLKKKVLEEGEAGGPELVPFSPRKLPGGAVAVRSPPEVPSLSGGTESESESVRGEGKVDGVTVKQKEEEKEEVKPLESVSLVGTLPSTHYAFCFVLSLCLAPHCAPLPPSIQPHTRGRSSRAPDQDSTTTTWYIHTAYKTLHSNLLCIDM